MTVLSLTDRLIIIPCTLKNVSIVPPQPILLGTHLKTLDMSAVFLILFATNTGNNKYHKISVCFITMLFIH